MVRFLAVFVALLVVFYIIAPMAWFADGVFPANLRFNAHIAEVILRLVGQDVQQADFLLVSPTFALEIRRGCDALEPIVIFCAATVAFPVNWRKRAAGMIVGMASLASVNILRIVTLMLAGMHTPRIFEILHTEIWQILFVAIAMGLWLTWAWWASHPDVVTHAAS